MKISLIAFFSLLLLCSASGLKQESTVELTCVKTLKATNTCHFNFKIDGMRYRYLDIGCKYSKSKDELLKKAKEGSLALAKDWKIECPEEKKAEAAPGSSGF